MWLVYLRSSQNVKLEGVWGVCLGVSYFKVEGCNNGHTYYCCLYQVLLPLPSLLFNSLVFSTCGLECVNSQLGMNFAS